MFPWILLYRIVEGELAKIPTVLLVIVLFWIEFAVAIWIPFVQLLIRFLWMVAVTVLSFWMPPEPESKVLMPVVQ
jgi:amino acid permease